MITSKQRTAQATIILVVASFLFVHLLFWLFPNVFEPWDAQTIDQLYRFRSASESLRPRYDSTIVHIDISDRTLELLENSYLNRSQYAQVIRNLGEMQAAQQVWDFIFAARTNREEDSVFIQSTAQAGNVYFGLAFNLVKDEQSMHRHPRNKRSDQYVDMTKWNVKVEGDTSELFVAFEPKITFPALAAASRGLGSLNILFDRDGVYRRAPLLFRYQNAMYPSFAFRAVCDYLDVTPDRIVVKPGTSITLRGAHKSGLPRRDVTIPVDRHGTMRVNYVGPLRRDSVNSMLHYDFADVLRASNDRLEMEDFRDLLKGKIAVVSEVATGASDVGPVPTDNDFPLSGVHANIINTILTEEFLTDLGALQMRFIELVMMAFLIILALRFSSKSFSLGSLLLLAAYVGCVMFSFLSAGVVLNLLRPSMEIAFSAFAVTIYRYISEQKEKEVLQRSFEAYFPPTVVKKIVANPQLVIEGVQKKELTILFSDIKSFTTYSSTMTPDQIHKFLNEYFEAMVEIVFKYEGTVDKFIGDGLMVFFGDPEDQPDHALRCVRAAVEMQKKCRELKVRWEAEGKFPLKIRIGINTGFVVVGNMGSSRRLSYTVLGSDVNLAQRLESNAPVEGVMISQRTYELVKDQVVTRPLEPIIVKGLEEPIGVYEVPVDGQLSL